MAQGAYASDSLTETCSTSPQIITLSQQSTQITFGVPPNSSNLYFNPYGNIVSTSNFEVPAGTLYVLEVQQPITQLAVVNDGTQGTYSILAH